MIWILIGIAIFSSTHAEDFNNEILVKRRHKLMESMNGGIAVFKNAGMALRNNDVHYYPFRTNSDFYYLTGFDEPDAAFLLLPDAMKKFIIFLQPENAMSSQWFGDVPGVQGAMEPGMVFAVEPLLYIGNNLIGSFRLNAIRRYGVSAEDIDRFLREIKPVFDQYNHIAARVEDDILITENGNDNLSVRLPRTVKDIEKAMAKKSYLNR